MHLYYRAVGMVFSEVGTDVLQICRSTPCRVHQYSGYTSFSPPPEALGPGTTTGTGTLALMQRYSTHHRQSPVLLFSGEILIELSKGRGALTRVVLVPYEQAWI
jgi:hypothetical protein